MEAREAIGKSIRRKGIASWLDLFITSGASEAIELCLTALVNPGEEVLTPSPGYPLYSAVLAKLQAQNVPYYLDEENNWEPDVADIRKKITPRTRALVLINPNNPTGSRYSREVLEEIVKLSLQHNLVIFSDEIYDKLVLDGEDSISIASLSDEAPIITMNGLSKSYLVPGFRIGWAVVTGKKKEMASYIDAVNRCLRARLCAVAPLQYAIEPALEGPQDHIEEVKAKAAAQTGYYLQAAECHTRDFMRKTDGRFLCLPAASYLSAGCGVRCRADSRNRRGGGARGWIRAAPGDAPHAHRVPPAGEDSGGSVRPAGKIHGQDAGKAAGALVATDRGIVDDIPRFIRRRAQIDRVEPEKQE